VNIVLLSNHWYPSPRKAGFHHLADAWHRQGHGITFATVGLSWISYVRGDFRTRYPGLRQARNVMQTVRENFASYVHFTPLHPHTTALPALDRLLAPCMDRYDRYPLGPLQERLQQADVIVYESCSALFLVNHCLELAPGARHIYRVSDDIRSLRSTPARMVEVEQQAAPRFSLISVPCPWLAKKFPGLASVRVQRPGLDTAKFDACAQSPYAPGSVNAVFCGLGFYDMDAVHAMAEQNPGVQLHVIGIKRPGSVPGNVTYHGELPFDRTIPYIKHAHCGLYTLRPSRRPMQAYTDSLKVIQYRYCGLPIVAPDFLDLHREGVFYYTPGNAASCGQALRRALEHGRHADYAREVRTWDEVAASMLA
jgi:2-beta-glucuronyltransferase